MEEIKSLLTEREKRLLQLKKEKEKVLKNVPEGTLRICSHGNRTQFYQRTDPKDFNGTYIKEKDFRIAQKLAQKDYDKKVLRSVESELKAIQKYNAAYPAKTAEQIYESIHKERQKLVLPIVESEEEYVEQWKSVQYQGKRFYEDLPELYTVNGERVRSKSEVIIADLLSREGIPYRYEYPVFLKDFGNVYPDFTVLNVRKRKEMYWEHFGMLDEPLYAEHAVQKIATYEQNGMIQGESLIFSYETKMKPLNQKLVLHLIHHYLQ